MGSCYSETSSDTDHYAHTVVSISMEYEIYLSKIIFPGNEVPLVLHILSRTGQNGYMSQITRYIKER